MVQWVKNLPAIQEAQETEVLFLGWEDPLEEENGSPLQYSCLKNSMDRGALQATVRGVTKSRTQLNADATVLSQDVQYSSLCYTVGPCC